MISQPIYARRRSRHTSKEITTISLLNFARQMSCPIFASSNATRSKSMSSADQLLSLPQDVQAQFAEVVRLRLAASEEEAGHLRERLGVLDGEIEKFKQFLASFPDITDTNREVRNAIAHSKNYSIFISHSNAPAPLNYDKDGTHASKILYVLRNPQKYPIEEPTFVGAGNVVKALKYEEPELRNESNSDLIKKFGPTLSRMATNGEVKKFLEKGTKGRIHYLSPDWFINDQIRPEYERFIQNLAPTP